MERAGGGHDYEVTGGGGVFVPGADGGSGDSIARYDLSAAVDDGPC
ncbi:hypothetical protein [Streptomyces rubiginosohelvolus]